MPQQNTALVVDRSHEDRQHVEALLRHSGGYGTVLHCASSHEAIGMLRARSVDIVCSAWQLGDGTSGELFAFLREEHSSRCVPRVMLFDGDGLSARETAQRERASDYVRKPLDRAELLQAVQRVQCLERGRRSRPCCELDLGFDEFNLYPARIAAFEQATCKLLTPRLKPHAGAIGDVGALTLTCDSQAPLVLHGRIAAIEEQLETNPGEELAITFVLEPTAEMGMKRFLALLEHCRRQIARAGG